MSSEHDATGIQKISDGPYQWGIIQGTIDEQTQHIRDNLAFGSGDVHGVYLPAHPSSVVGNDPLRPEHLVCLCICGNGPNSKNNAIAITDLLNVRRELNVIKGSMSLPIPTTPDAVAWAEWAIRLENALGIGANLPDPQQNKEIGNG